MKQNRKFELESDLRIHSSMKIFLLENEEKSFKID